MFETLGSGCISKVLPSFKLSRWKTRLEPKLCDLAS